MESKWGILAAIGVGKVVFWAPMQNVTLAKARHSPLVFVRFVKSLGTESKSRWFDPRARKNYPGRMRNVKMQNAQDIYEFPDSLENGGIK